ncbi:GGDEF domain-containing protein [Actinoplanes sp. NPDC051861]|uniref:GGDEF domain-containing protein n=1 Tax=Actinoplanes sp. NPDC051861 TaxID=3155170 RepID=UPI0034252960
MRLRIRDPHGAARAVAYLMLVAAVYLLVTGVLLKLGDPVVELAALGVVSVAFLLVGLICLRTPEKLPRLFWLSVPFVSAGVVTGLNLATRDTSTGAQLFYLWPLLYAASFLSRVMISATVAAISAGHALLAFSFMDGLHAFNDWSALTVAMSMVAFVVAALVERNDRLRDVLEVQATQDALTGAANRRAFDDRLAGTADEAAHGGRPLALVMIDVDHFKSINDTWGHATGDRALRTVAEALRDSASGNDHLVARLGGDEFAVLLRAGPYEAIRYAEQARTLVEAARDLPCGPPRLSIGVAVVPDHATGAEDLQRVADAALYRAKAGGRGRSVLAGDAVALN